MSRNFLCFACAESWLVDASVKASICPACGSENDAVQQQFLIDYARAVVRFGHQYREKYDSDVESAASRRYFLAPPPEWLVFVGAAILSGVIGNASYDTIKSVVARIVSRYEDEMKASVVDDAFLRRLDDQFRDYLTHLRTVAPSVRSAILEEVLVDLMEEYQAGHPELRATLARLTPGSQEAVAFVQEWRNNAIQMARLRAKPGPEDFADLWEQIRRPDA